METLGLLRIIAPEFKNVEDTIANEWIELTQQLVSQTAFGNRYQQAVAYLTAHRMKMAGLGETGIFGSMSERTGVVSYTEGSTSVSFGNNTGITGSDACLSMTSYGMEYLRLQQTIIPIMVRRDEDGSA